eukprot:IDg10820t1
MLPPIPRAPPFSKEEVLNAAKKFPRAFAAGGSGFSSTHLLELLQATDADRKNGLQEALAAGLGDLANGKGPPDLAPWLAGAPLTALRKDNDGVRPIAVGETIQRLTSSLLLARNAAEARDQPTPLQIGVATPARCEAAVHAVRELAHKYRDDGRLGLLQVDLANAFNVVSRASFRKE